MKRTAKTKVVVLAVLVLSVMVVVFLRFFSMPVTERTEIRNVLLISIDTCRADHLSCYGFSRETTPNIDNIASRGVLFENAISPVPITLPAHCSMMTGNIPPYHGVHKNASFKLDDSSVTLAEILRSNGFATVGIISSFVLERQFGLSQGFDTYEDSFKQGREGLFGSERVGAETSAVAMDWLDENKDKKFFMFLHYYDPHLDYEPPEPFASTYADEPYAGEIAYTDFCIGKVIEKLKTLGLYESTLIVIAGDHGEMLGEHGEIDHRFFVYQSAIKVPLLFGVPGQKKPKRITELAGLVDILPTICSLLDIEVPARVQGKDLLAEVNQKRKRTEPEQRYFYCESYTPVFYGANPLLAVLDNEFKYIRTTRPELYDLVEDPGEVNNLAGDLPQKVRILEDKLQQILEQNKRKAQTRSQVELDDSAIKRLESLGYVDAGVKVEFEFDKNRNDAKDMIGFHTEFKKVVSYYYEKEYGQAKKICEKLVKQWPGFYRTSLYLGKIALKQNDYAAAAEHLNRVLKYDRDNYENHNSLAKAYFQLKRVDLAIKHLKEVARLKPDFAEAISTLAWMLMTVEDKRLRDTEAAIRYATKACELTDYKHFETVNSLALVYGAAGDIPGAIRASQKSLELARAAGNKKMAQKIQARLQRYRILQK